MTGAADTHAPVMAAEVLAAVAPAPGEVIVDATFGGGGYSRAFLDAADCTVCAIDRDPAAIARGAALVARYAGRLRLLEGAFGDMERLLAAEGVTAVNGVAFDLGLSSFQLAEAERGFSFAKEGPLDMRMGDVGLTAADVVNTASQADLADIFWRFGDEKRSRRIARAIVSARQAAPVETTARLAGIVEEAVGKRGGEKIHPATRVFQALRIYVNDELGQLESGLKAAERLLQPAGRLCVVSFHSLEDRLVKRFLSARSGQAPRGSRHLPSSTEATTPGAPAAPSFRLPFKKPQRPGEDEIARNPRARSARLRAAVRTDAPPWETEVAA